MKIHGIINFQGSSLNGLSKNSSPNELSKLSAHSLEGVRWESQRTPIMRAQLRYPNEVSKLQPG